MAKLIVELNLGEEQINKFQFEAHCANKTVDNLATEIIAVYIKSGDMANGEVPAIHPVLNGKG